MNEITDWLESSSILEKTDFISALVRRNCERNFLKKIFFHITLPLSQMKEKLFYFQKPLFLVQFLHFSPISFRSHKSPERIHPNRTPLSNFSSLHIRQARQIYPHPQLALKCIYIEEFAQPYPLLDAHAQNWAAIRRTFKARIQHRKPWQIHQQNKNPGNHYYKRRHNRPWKIWSEITGKFYYDSLTVSYAKQSDVAYADNTKTAYWSRNSFFQLRIIFGWTLFSWATSLTAFPSWITAITIFNFSSELNFLLVLPIRCLSFVIIHLISFPV